MLAFAVASYSLYRAAKGNMLFFLLPSFLSLFATSLTVTLISVGAQAIHRFIILFTLNYFDVFFFCMLALCCAYAPHSNWNLLSSRLFFMNPFLFQNTYSIAIKSTTNSLLSLPKSEERERERERERCGPGTNGYLR